MEKKVNMPKKGAGRKLAQKLKELGEQKPPKGLMDKLNKKDEAKGQQNQNHDHLIWTFNELFADVS